MKIRGNWIHSRYERFYFIYQQRVFIVTVGKAECSCVVRFGVEDDGLMLLLGGKVIS